MSGLSEHKLHLTFSNLAYNPPWWQCMQCQMHPLLCHDLRLQKLYFPSTIHIA